MKFLDTGKYYGNLNNSIFLDGLIITDTIYTHKYVGWHYHENPYFTFLLQGKLFEANKKESYHCNPGTVLFHNWQDAHYNIKPGGFAQGLHIEMNSNWLEKNGIAAASFEGSKLLQSVYIKNLLLKIYDAIQFNPNPEKAVIEELVLRLWYRSMRLTYKSPKGLPPNWVSTVKEILHSGFTENITLDYLSLKTGLHSVYLCAEFPRYFNTSIGNYIRSLRIQKSEGLLKDPGLRISEIAYLCGFSDQSHFTREFKKLKYMTPAVFRKLYSPSKP